MTSPLLTEHTYSRDQQWLGPDVYYPASSLPALFPCCAPREPRVLRYSYRWLGVRPFDHCFTAERMQIPVQVSYVSVEYKI